jgi:lipopolysaccharide assembly outer membrane protein LptD (OstA)
MNFLNTHQKRFVCLPGLALLPGLFVALIPVTIHAEEDQWRLCATPIKTDSTKEQTVKDNTSEASVNNEMIFTADEFEVTGPQYRLKGKVEGGRGNQRLSADSLNYDKNTDLAEAIGNVRFEYGERILTGDSATINLGDNSGNLKSARFWLPYKHIRGQADSIEFKGVAETRLKNAIFTTCEEGSDDWLLKASSLHLDTEKNEGIARHARIRFMSVPIFYFPYLSFPLEGRKSGFLAPAIGGSSNSGTEISIPYYWNIAPHRDATIAPQYLSRRGLLMETEFRYLNERSHGQINIDHINDDRIFGEDRTAVNVQHQGSPSHHWRTQLNYRHVSDEDLLPLTTKIIICKPACWYKIIRHLIKHCLALINPISACRRFS